jgi:gliding motility associated protien GldN
MKRLLTVVFIFILALETKAQENKVLDGIFIKETAPTRRVVPYTHIREADVMYYKRVWRRIDLREKMNFPLYYPEEPINEIGYERVSLFEVIKRGVEEGTLTAYEDDGLGGNFQIPLPKSEASGKLSKEVTEETVDPVTGEFVQSSYTEEVKARNVIEYRLKEDWVFDRERSVMEVRIIGILPIIEEENVETGQKKPKALFWIYFPEARYVFANQEVYNPTNDGSRLTFEDLFRKRAFSSYIFRETNVFDNRMIDDYTDNIDLLLESRRVEHEIINVEHDMWQY